MKHLIPLLTIITLLACSKEPFTPEQQSTLYPYYVTHDDLNYRGLEYYRVIVNDTTVTQITNGGYWEDLPVIATVTPGTTIQVEFAYFQNEAFGDHTMTTTITVGDQSMSWPESSWGEYSFIVE